MAEHTPGPWKAHRGPNGNWRIDAADGSAWIAETVPMRDLDTEQAIIDTEADARLIAAAPDLLDACKTTLRFLEVNGYGDQFGLPGILRAAIGGMLGGPVLKEVIDYISNGVQE